MLRRASLTSLSAARRAVPHARTLPEEASVRCSMQFALSAVSPARFPLSLPETVLCIAATVFPRDKQVIF